jgi:hypothetical protein
MLKNNLNEVRRSVNPTNRVKHGIRQVLFPHQNMSGYSYLNLAICENKLKKKEFNRGI